MELVGWHVLCPEANWRHRESVTLAKDGEPSREALIFNFNRGIDSVKVQAVYALTLEEVAILDRRYERG